MLMFLRNREKASMSRVEEVRVDFILSAMGHYLRVLSKGAAGFDLNF